MAFFFRKLLNEQSKCSSLGIMGAVFQASALCLTGNMIDLLDFVVIIVLIFYILTILDIHPS
jgi:APA family basic amino acid/polyamine antiporter